MPETISQSRTKPESTFWSHRLLIRASAGSGKTHQLSTRLIRLLVSDEPIDSILAMTFTRKAAGEIRDRVFQRLAKAATDPKALQELRKALEIKGKQLDGEVLASRLRELIMQQHRLAIGTLDSFFSQLAQVFSFDLLLPSGWRLADPFEESSMQRDAVRRTIEHLPTGELQTLMHMLSKDELKSNLMEELLSVAEGGYRVFQGAVSDIWANPVVTAPPPEVDLQQAIRLLEQNQFPKPSVAKAFRKVAELAMTGNWLALAEETLMQNLLQGNEKYGPATLDDPTLVAAARVLLRRGQAEVLRQLRAQTEATGKILRTYHGHLTAIKQHRRLLAFDDLTHGLGTLLDHQRSLDGGLSEEIRQRLDVTIKHILLDEFQDTAPIQWRVVEPFLNTALREGGSFFCVGDTKQAIYGWRGGQARLFDAVGERIRDVRAVELAKSHRSSPVIMEAVNRCFRQLDNHTELSRSARAVQSFVNSFPKHETYREQSQGYVVLETAPQLEDTDVDPCEARAVDIVCELRQRQPHCEIAILTRSNPPIGRLISRLRSLGIDASQEGGNPLTDSAGVELILSVLRLADHPGDLVAGFHVGESPLADQFCLPELPDGQREKGIEFARAISRNIRAKLVECGLGRTVSDLVAQLRTVVSPLEYQRLRQLVTLAHRFEPSFRLRSVDFIEFVEMERVASPTAKPVRVMTIHMSKGLEFDAVVLPELDVDLIGTADLLITRSRDLTAPPSAAVRYCSKEKRAYLSDGWNRAFEQDEDDRTTGSLCTLYVALTRAKHALYLLVPPQRKPRPTDKKMAALLVNALGWPNVDATQPGTTLFEDGLRDWLVDPRPATQLGLRFDEAHDTRPLKWYIPHPVPQQRASSSSATNKSGTTSR